MEERIQNEVAGWQLVDAYRGGDDAAFLELVRLHSPLIASICRRRSGLHPPDVVDETWYRVLLRVRADDMARHRSITSWIRGIALNVLQAKSMRAECGTIADTTPAEDVDPADYVQESELSRAVGDCLLRVEPRLTTVYQLHYGEGLALVRVAEFLSCSEANVRQKMLPKLQRLVAACLQKRGFSGSIVVGCKH